MTARRPGRLASAPSTWRNKWLTTPSTICEDCRRLLSAARTAVSRLCCERNHAPAARVDRTRTTQAATIIVNRLRCRETGWWIPWYRSFDDFLSTSAIFNISLPTVEPFGRSPIVPHRQLKVVKKTTQPLIKEIHRPTASPCARQSSNTTGRLR